MSLPVLAMAALLVGGATVLSVMATAPLPAPGATPGDPAVLPGRVPAGPGADGRLDLRVRNEGEEATVTISVRSDGGQAVFTEQVTLPARQDWRKTLALPPQAYTARMDVPVGGHASGSGDLRECLRLHGLWEAHVDVGPGGLGMRFGSRSIACADGPAADAPPPPAPGEGGPHRMEGKATIGAAYTGVPGPGCLAPCRASYAHLSGSVGFGLVGPAQVLVRAFWDPSTPASERLAVGLYRETGGGAAEGIGGAEGARDVVFEADAPGEGHYLLHAWPAGPVGVAVRQEVNYEVTWTYG